MLINRKVVVMNEKCEIVYVLKNEAMPGLIKIGKTQRSDIQERMNELHTTGVPLPFECLWAGEVSDCKRIESVLHNAFRDKRVNPKREFFSIEPDQVIPLLEEFATNVIEITSQLGEALNKDVTKEEKDASETYKKRRPNLNFEEMGIENNSELVFIKDTEIKATVIEPQKILHNEQVYSLSGLTKELLGNDYYVAPCRYWTYNGKNLDDIYEETYTYVY